MFALTIAKQQLLFYYCMIKALVMTVFCIVEWKLGKREEDDPVKEVTERTPLLHNSSADHVIHEMNGFIPKQSHSEQNLKSRNLSNSNLSPDLLAVSV